MDRRRKWTRERIAIAREMGLANLSPAEIGARLGVTGSAITQAHMRHDLGLRDREIALRQPEVRARISASAKRRYRGEP